MTGQEFAEYVHRALQGLSYRAGDIKEDKRVVGLSEHFEIKIYIAGSTFTVGLSMVRGINHVYATHFVFPLMAKVLCLLVATEIPIPICGVTDVSLAGDL